MKRSLCLALLAAVPLLATTGCIPSNVVAAEDRAVVIEDLEGLEWTRLALADDLVGLYHSVRLEGPLASALESISYRFADDGSFSGAALFGGPPPSFQVLDGSYRLLDDGRLELGEGTEPAEVVIFEELLRLSGPDGTVYLQRERTR